MVVQPRTGTSEAVGEVAAESRKQFVPPADGDWVLVIDDAAKGFRAPVASSKRGLAPQPVRPRPTGTDGSGSFLATRGLRRGNLSLLLEFFLLHGC